jgi:hypothetical protein
MTAEAASHGQAGGAGTPASGRQTRLTAAAPTAIKVVVESGSKPTLMSAFHPAWHAAANRTATKTKFCTREPYTGVAPSTMKLDLLADRPKTFGTTRQRGPANSLLES